MIAATANAIVVASAGLCALPIAYATSINIAINREGTVAKIKDLKSNKPSFVFFKDKPKCPFFAAKARAGKPSVIKLIHKSPAAEMGSTLNIKSPKIIHKNFIIGTSVHLETPLRKVK